MEEAQTENETRFAAVVDALARNPSITHSKAGSRLFGSETLKVHDKLFAMLSSGGQFVVKLPKARVEDLVAAGTGQRFDAHQGRPMKEWLEVASASSQDWLELAREALEFVGTWRGLVLERSATSALAVGREGLTVLFPPTPAAAKRTLEFFTTNQSAHYPRNPP